MCKAPLKWAGGKRWLAPKIKEIYSNYLDFRLVEPFSGGLSVALELKPKKALLNDINFHLINFYQQVKTGLVINSELENDKIFFDSIKEKFNQLIRDNKSDSKLSAEYFYYLNKTSFNGLCRFNSKGFYNVPFGKYKKINYKKDFFEYQNIFKDWDFSCQDFEKLTINNDDFIYLDPPYDVEFTMYSKENFKWEDQVRLVKWLNNFTNPIVISNQATERVIKLYKENNFQVEIVSAPRRISSNGDRKNVNEVIAYKNI